MLLRLRATKLAWLKNQKILESLLSQAVDLFLRRILGQVTKVHLPYIHVQK